MLGFYFPIKWFVSERENGIKILFIVLIWTGLIITIRNVLQLQELLSQATMAWQVTRKGRVATNEILIVLPAFTALVWALHSRLSPGKLLRYVAFLFFVLGIVLTQSRGYWVSFSFGMLIVFLVLAHRARVELVLVGVVGLSAAIGLVFTLFGDTAVLLVAGLLNRIISLATATTSDPSLLNRFLENRALMAKISDNPIMGYGMGVSYSFHDLTVGGTKARAFIHNGYLGLWYRFGIVGLITVMTLWLGSIRNAISIARRSSDAWSRYGAMVTAAGLSSILVSGMTSTPFYQNDLMLMFALMTGMTAGIAKRDMRQVR
jgi:O-antigen ligase